MAEAVQAGAWVCCVEADGRVQPLVSIAHTAVLPGLEWALSAGQYRLRPAFESAAEVLARVHGTDPEAAFCRTPVEELNLKTMTLKCGGVSANVNNAEGVGDGGGSARG